MASSSINFQFTRQLQAVRGCIELADGSLLTGRQFRMQTHRAIARDRTTARSWGSACSVAWL